MILLIVLSCRHTYTNLGIPTTTEKKEKEIFSQMSVFSYFFALANQLPSFFISRLANVEDFYI